jgi:DNA-binding PadR family transcriptional regulator
MSLKHALLALVAERRGYGYELAQRLDARVGPGWQLNASAVYPALEQLERTGLVEAAVRPRDARQGPRVLYTITPAGGEALDAWMSACDDRPEPVRSELHLRLACARPADRPALRAQVAARRRGCEELLARFAAAAPGPGEAPPDDPLRLIAAGVAARLRAEVAWLRDVEVALAEGS